MNYERLTNRKMAGVKEIVVHKKCDKECCWYKHCENCHLELEMLNRLAELEDKLENGLLVERDN